MKQLDKADLLLDLIRQPAFRVVDSVIQYVNHAAKGLFITEGTNINEWIPTDMDAYNQFTGGCLYLTMDVVGNKYGAIITHNEEADIFIIDDRSQLTAVELAGRQLRLQVSNIMAVLDSLPNAKHNKAVGQVQQNAYQMFRAIANMCDANTWHQKAAVCEYANVREIFNEAAEKTLAMPNRNHIQLTYRSPDRPVNTMINPEMLQRALYNMFSNAIKFSDPNGQVTAEMMQSGNKLRISVQNTCSDIRQENLTTAFIKYLREPIVEDPVNGIGLGMRFIYSAATSNGGTVLIDLPEPDKVRVTMTLTIRKPNRPTKLRSPVTKLSNYVGGLDLTLVELSDVLTVDAFMAN